MSEGGRGNEELQRTQKEWQERSSPKIDVGIMMLGTMRQEIKFHYPVEEEEEELIYWQHSLPPFSSPGQLLLLGRGREGQRVWMEIKQLQFHSIGVAEGSARRIAGRGGGLDLGWRFTTST